MAMTSDSERYCMPGVPKTHHPSSAICATAWRTAVVASLLLGVSSTLVQLAAAAGDLDALLDGVREIAAPGVPGTLCVFGDNAFAVVVGRSGRAFEPVVAACRIGKGRAVGFGHDGYLGQGALDVADTGRLMLNAVRWAAAKPSPRVAVRGLQELLAFFREHGLPAEPLDGDDWLERLGDYDVLCIHAGGLPMPDQAPQLVKYLRSGGGLITAHTGWGWLQLSPGKCLATDFPATQLLAPGGLIWGDGTLNRTSAKGFSAEARPSELTNASRALDALEAHATGRRLTAEDLAQAGWSVVRTASVLPPNDEILLPRLRRVQQRHAAEAVPTPQKPLGADNTLARLALTLQLQDLRRTPPQLVKAHPAAAAFPGAVPPDAPRVEKRLEIDTQVPGWHSTGLYAAPSEVIEVEIPQNAVGKGLAVQIGCHTDVLWHLDSWRRAPEIVRSFPLDAAHAKAANAFGGLVYIVVPENCRLGTLSVIMRGAVEAPHFILGRTTPEDWRNSVRNRLAPWAELECSKVIVTLPSEHVRKLDDPVELMELWSNVLDACASLAAMPLERARPERFVTDVQISAGYMHSGYPIMTHLDVAPVLADRAALFARAADGGAWGFFHELGHNHQSPDWTFDGTGEVTENLFSLYVLDRVFNVRQAGHPAVKPAERERVMREYFAAPSFEKWKSNPFLALYMYMQLQEAFGWEAFRKVFAEYRRLTEAERPKTDDEKRDQWLVRFSKVVGRNLGPFFEAWRVPTSEAARASVADLPPWMPPGFPPQ
ncbi:MAG: hypothetical protein H5T86_00990 [Armatimonadetes bacterium]|nr:hypothetical protein [Armatimonadota bacterium]